MAQPFDPGLTQRYLGNFKRFINHDGSFNIRRRGGGSHLYLYLISVSWTRFFFIALLTYLSANLLFAGVYIFLGVEHLYGGDPALGSFGNAFFFSTQTLTTVGYGHIAPRGLAVNSVAALEGMAGVLGFAVITGLLYGRVSRPSAKIAFSHQMLVKEYNGGSSLQFRIANYRPNVLMDLQAVMVLMTVEQEGDQMRRKYTELTLERNHVYFFPLTWTVVHPIGADSPLYGRSAEVLAALQAEVIILIRAFDDTFSQTVNARHSYAHEDFVWSGEFEPAFSPDEGGGLILDVSRVGALRSAPPGQEGSVTTKAL